MTLLRQSLVTSRLSLQSLPQRIWPALVIVVSMACVVGVLLSMLAETAGLARAYRTGDDPRQAIVLSSQSLSEYGGGISRNDVATIIDAPGIARGANGKPAEDAELLFWVPPTQGYTINSPELRGLGPEGLALRPEIRIVSGRWFRSGAQELVIGVQAQRAFGMQVGNKVILPNGGWPIVGIFSAGGGIVEGQLLGDADTLMTAGRMTGFGSVLVRLTSPDAFESFRRWLTTNPSLGVTAEKHSDYSLRTVDRYAAFFTKVAYAVGVIMALGALFGSVKIMYTAVSVRTREIGTLGALGYEALPVAISVVTETVLLAILGASLGACLAWFLSNGKVLADNEKVFTASVTPQLLLLGLGWAVATALLGALAPAIRAARLSVSEALRTA